MARLAAAVGGRYLVLLPVMYRDLLTGEYVEAQELDEDGWVQFNVERVEYMHVKQVDPATMSVVKDKDLGFYDAVQLGAICTPPAGVPRAESITRDMWRLDPEIFVIVEQDMFPCHPDAPFPIVVRTAACLRHARLAR